MDDELNKNFAKFLEETDNTRGKLEFLRIKPMKRFKNLQEMRI